MRRRGTVQPAWLFALGALDLAAISFSSSISGGFNSPCFPAYYTALAVFAYVFTSPRLVLPWTTLVAAVYSVLSFTVEPGLDLASCGLLWPPGSLRPGPDEELRNLRSTSQATNSRRTKRSWPCQWPQRHDSCSFLRLQNGTFSLNVHRP